MPSPMAPPPTSAAPHSPASTADLLRMNERPRILKVLRANSGGGPESECAHRAGRVVAGVLREGGRALDEQVRHVPALQIFVQGTVARIVAHDSAATEMRRLIVGNVIWAFTRLLDDLRGAHLLQDSAYLSVRYALILSSLSWKSMVMPISGRPKRSL